MRSYLRGDTYPSLDRLSAMAAAADVREAWLATGEGPMRSGGESQVQEESSPYRPLDERIMGEVIAEVERCLHEQGIEISPLKKTEIILLAYSFVSLSGRSDRATIERLVRLAS